MAGLGRGGGYLETLRREEVGIADRVSVQPLEPADWDIMKFNQKGDQKYNYVFVVQMEISAIE